MKAEFINPFLKASINLFKEYLGLKAESGKPYLRRTPRTWMKSPRSSVWPGTLGAP